MVGNSVKWVSVFRQILRNFANEINEDTHMKSLFINRLMMTALTLLVMACGHDDAGEMQAQPTNNASMTQKINMTIDGQTLSVTLVDNSATQALVTALAEGPITYEADDYGGFEKVGPLGRSLPTSNQQITTEPGDVILYSGNQIVLFYGSNSWSYTRLGRISYDSLDQLKSFLKAGQGRISVTLSLSEPTGMRAVRSDSEGEESFVTLNGMRTRGAKNGIVLKRSAGRGQVIKTIKR